jgi:hypothetical protein
MEKRSRCVEDSGIPPNAANWRSAVKYQWRRSLYAFAPLSSSRQRHQAYDMARWPPAGAPRRAEL